MSHEVNELMHGFHAGVASLGALAVAGILNGGRDNGATEAARAARLQTAARRGEVSGLEDVIDRLRDDLAMALLDAKHLRLQVADLRVDLAAHRELLEEMA